MSHMSCVGQHSTRINMLKCTERTDKEKILINDKIMQAYIGTPEDRDLHNRSDPTIYV